MCPRPSNTKSFYHGFIIPSAPMSNIEHEVWNTFSNSSLNCILYGKVIIALKVLQNVKRPKNLWEEVTMQFNVAKLRTQLQDEASFKNFLTISTRIFTSLQFKTTSKNVKLRKFCRKEASLHHLWYSFTMI